MILNRCLDHRCLSGFHLQGDFLIIGIKCSAVRIKGDIHIGFILYVLAVEHCGNIFCLHEAIAVFEIVASFLLLLLFVKGRVALYPIPDAIPVLQLFQQNQGCIIAFFDAVYGITFFISVFIYGNTGIFHDSKRIAVVIPVPHGVIHFIKVLGCFFSPVGIGCVRYIHTACLVSEEAAVKLKLAGIHIRIGQVMHGMGIYAA